MVDAAVNTAAVVIPVDEDSSDAMIPPTIRHDVSAIFRVRIAAKSSHTGFQYENLFSKLWSTPGAETHWIMIRNLSDSVSANCLVGKL